MEVAMPTARQTPHLSWEQLSLVPRELVTAELTLHLDGPRNAIQVSWRIRETASEAWIGAEVLAPVPGLVNPLPFTRAARELHQRALGALQPF
jgi:hypothetical protein